MLRISGYRTVENPGSVRVIADVTHNGECSDLWYEFPARYKPYLTLDRSDALAVGMLLECMHRGCDLSVEGTVSATLLSNLEMYAHVMRALFPHLKPIHVKCDEVRYFDATFHGRQLASSFSGGIDSQFTVLRHLQAGAIHRQLQHLAFVNVGSHGRGQRGAMLFRKRAARITDVARKLGLPVLFIDSNLDQFYTMRFEDSHAARTASAVLLFQGLFHTYLIPATNSYAAFGPDGSTPIGDHLLSTDVMRFVHDGADCSRIEKSARLAECSIAQATLDVCMTPTPSGGNCSYCDKCVRAMITFDMLGVHDRFRQVFDYADFLASKRRFVRRMAKKGIGAPNFYWRELVLHSELVGYKLFE
jgi:hypothetical protein